MDSTRCVYVHVHIPKNAGLTMDGILRRHFGSGFARAPEAYPGQVFSLEEKRAWLAQQPEVRCVSGHAFRYPAPPQPDQPYLYFTLLRQPVERLVSLYAYEQQQTAGNPAHGSHGPIEGWIDYRLAEDHALSNAQTYHLLGLTNPAELDLARAKQLVDEFLLVGLAEQFDDSLQLLARRAGWPPDSLAYQRVNVTHSKERFPVSAATRRRLTALNEIDEELYDYARAKLARDLASLPANRPTPPAPLHAPANRPGTPWWARWARRFKQR